MNDPNDQRPAPLAVTEGEESADRAESARVRADAESERAEQWAAFARREELARHRAERFEVFYDWCVENAPAVVEMCPYKFAGSRDAAAEAPAKRECGFCHGKPVGDAASWLDGKPRPPAPCPRCGETNTDAPSPAAASKTTEEAIVRAFCHVREVLRKACYGPGSPGLTIREHDKAKAELGSLAAPLGIAARVGVGEEGAEDSEVMRGETRPLDEVLAEIEAEEEASTKTVDAPDGGAEACCKPMRGLYYAVSTCARPLGHSGPHHPVWDYQDWTPTSAPAAASVSGNTAAGAWGDCDCGLEACNAEVRRLQAALDALVAEREELVAERTSLGCELARLLGPRKPREGVTLNDQWIAAVAAVVAERDEAQDAVRELACTIAAGQALEEAVAELAQAGAVRETASSWAAELAGEKQLLRKFIESVAALDPSRGPMDCHGLVKNARAVLAGVSGPPADTEAKP